MSLENSNRNFTAEIPDLTKKSGYEDWHNVVAGMVQRRRKQELFWRKLYDDYRKTIDDVGDDEINVNMTFGNLRVLEAMLYYEDPYIRIRPLYDINLAVKAKLLQDVLNQTWYQERVGREIRNAIVDAGLIGWGPLMVGFSDYHDPDKYVGQGHVHIRRINPLDLYVEDDITDFRDATIWVRRCSYSIRWLRKTFPKLEWKPDIANESLRRRGIRQQFASQAELYEIVDLVEARVLVLSPQHQTIIHEMEYPYEYFNGPPYVILSFVSDPERLYPISMTGIVMGQQYELDKLRTMQMVHRKRFNRRYVTNRDLWDESELEKIEFGEDGTIAYTKGDPKDAIFPIPDAPLDPGTTREYQMDIKEDMREILGINEYTRAGAIPRVKTATESNMIQQGANIRSRNLSTNLHDCIVDVARRASLVLQNEYDGINYLAKQGENAEIFSYVQWTKEDIIGDFEVEIELGSTLPPQPLPYEMLQPALAAGNGQMPGNNGGGGMPMGGPEAAQLASQAGTVPEGGV